MSDVASGGSSATVVEDMCMMHCADQLDDYVVQSDMLC